MLSKCYKFNAECEADIIELQKILPGVYLIDSLELTESDNTKSLVPDVIVILFTEVPAINIIETMNSLQDSHIMVETIMEIEGYNDKRFYQRRQYLQNLNKNNTI